MPDTYVPIASIGVLFVVAIGCASEKRRAYESIGRDANPLLEKIRPALATMAAITGEDPDSNARLVEVCKSADAQLWLLRNIRLKQPYDAEPQVSDVASWLLDRRDVFCRPAEGAPFRIAECSRFCREYWDAFVSAADRLRLAAGKEGVNIVTLHVH